MGLTKMKKTLNPKSSKEKKNSISNNFIILIFSILTLFYESIVIILSIFNKGFVKKEVLSKNTNLGFDLIIRKK